MSRAAGGLYTLPAGNPVVTGTIISSTWGNTTLADIATALTDSLSRSGLGGMTAPLLLPDGSAALPGLSFTNEVSSGLYRIGAGSLGMSVLARLGMSWAAAGNVAIAAPSSGVALTVTDTATAVNTTLGLISFSNGTVLGAGRPEIYTGAAATFNLGTTAAQSLEFVTQSLARLSISATGAVTINAVTGAGELVIAGGATVTSAQPNVSLTAAAANSAILSVAGNAAVVGTSDLQLIHGTTSIATLVNRANAAFNIGTNNVTNLAILAAGNVTVNAPTSGVALTVTGFAGSSALVLSGSGTTPQIQLDNAAYLGGKTAAATVTRLIGISAANQVIIGSIDAAAAGGILFSNNGTQLSITSDGHVNIVAPSGTVSAALTVNAIAGAHSVKIADSANASFNAGFLELPLNTQNAAYTTVLADAGKAIYHSDGTARTYTIDSNANVPYPIGTTLTFVNDASGAVNVTISITADTLVLSPGGTTGSRTLAQFGRATAHKVTATRWMISGSGLT